MPIEVYEGGTDFPVVLEIIEIETPPLPIDQRLDNLFRSQPVDVQAQFWELRVAVKDALVENPLVAKKLIENKTVPPELAQAKQALLDEFDAT